MAFWHPNATILDKPSSASAVTFCVPTNTVVIAVAPATVVAVATMVVVVAAVGKFRAAAGAGAACMGFAAIAGEAVSLGIATVACPLQAHATSATWVQATSVSAVAVNESAQVLSAISTICVTNLSNGRLAALCDHPGRIPSKLSVHLDEGGVHAVAE
eukprot:SAG22_NODE_3051_length_1980_cov_3.110993_1_plen_158_part_00